MMAWLKKNPKERIELSLKNERLPGWPLNFITILLFSATAVVAESDLRVRPISKIQIRHSTS
jgi:hypothetical protein